MSILGLPVVAGIAGILFAKIWLPKVNDVLHDSMYVLLRILMLIAISL